MGKAVKRKVHAVIPNGTGNVAVRCVDCHLAPGAPIRAVYGWYVECATTGCWTGPIHDNEIDAIHAWNKVMTLTRWEVKP